MTKSLDESAGTNHANYTKDLFFWVCNFHGFFGSEFAWLFIFLGIMTNVWTEFACHPGGVTISQES